MSGLGEAQNVTMTTEEFSKLVVKFGEALALDWIEKVSLWKASKKGTRVKSDYFTILNWARKDRTIEAHTVVEAPLIVESELRHRAEILQRVRQREGLTPNDFESCLKAIREIEGEK